MSENLSELLAQLPSNLANHLIITVVPLTLGVLVSVPLAISVVKVKALRYPTLTIVSIIQTIPSLALLALMVPLLVGIGALTSRAFGFEVPILGFLPVVIALTLYSMLPMVRNTVTGILGVSDDLTEAARGLGMTPQQVLWKVELPLAAPVILAGVRTATVWTVGIATLATPVGQRCLGNFIFRGLQTRNWLAVIMGCVFAAIVAVLLDLMIGGLEKSVADRHPRLGVASGLALLLFIGGSLVSPWIVKQSRSGGEVIHVGSKTFTEQYILARLIRDVSEDAGFEVSVLEGLGSTILFEGLAENRIDVYVDYSGTIWANYMKREAGATPEQVLDEMTGWLESEHGIRVLGPLGFENAYGLAMRRDRAEELGIETIEDLAPYSSEMKIGGDYEFFGRPEWIKVRDTYGLGFADQISYDSTFMYEAVNRGEVDVISAFTSDGRIAAMDLVVLDDPKNAIPPYDAVLLLSEEAAANEKLVEALEPLVGTIDVDLMRRANYRVDREEGKETVAEAAEWLRAEALGD